MKHCTLEDEPDELLPKIDAFMKFPTWGVVIGFSMWLGIALIVWIAKGAKIP